MNAAGFNESTRMSNYSVVDGGDGGEAGGVGGLIANQTLYAANLRRSCAGRNPVTSSGPEQYGATERHWGPACAGVTK
jgi:hypothetical protein